MDTARTDLRRRIRLRYLVDKSNTRRASIAAAALPVVGRPRIRLERAVEVEAISEHRPTTCALAGSLRSVARPFAPASREQREARRHTRRRSCSHARARASRRARSKALAGPLFRSDPES